MSLKQEIETWVDALGQYDNNEFEEALKTFDGIADTSKILFNCGVIHATLGEHDKAVECYQRAVALDKYLAVAYFQQGVSNFLVGDFEEALANFNDTLLYLRGNSYIDYDQLGLKFKLYSCEVLFNRGLCYIYLQQKDTGLTDLTYAVKEKVTPDHDVIDDAIAEQAEGYTVFSIPVGIVYRPNPAKVKNLKTKDYLGKARLVASTEKDNAFTGFAGTARLPIVITSVDSKGDRPSEEISFAASNLVRNDITSRSMRQQSEPPANRNVFPPTPPPENDAMGRPSLNKSATMPAPASNNDPLPRTARANSVRNGPMGGSVRTASRRYPPPQAQRIEEDRPFSPPNSGYAPPSRSGTIRTASEPRGGPMRGYSQRGYGPPPSRGRLFMEARRGDDDDIDEYPEELYDMYRDSGYGANPYNAGGGSRRRMDSRFDNLDRDSGGSSLDDFEMMNETLPRRGMSTRISSARSGGGASSGEPELRSVRVKMHYADDTRYVMCSTNIDFDGFQDKVREKLGLRGRMRIKIKDEGDLITVGDRDDWDIQVTMARKTARKLGEEMARMEVWVTDG